MPYPTYKELVNEVLVRLREEEINDVKDNILSRLVGNLVNKTKREVEDSWNWQALRMTFEMNTAEDIFNYVLPGSTTRFRVHSAWNTTTDTELIFMPSNEMDRLFRTDRTKGAPAYYSWNGVDVNGDTKVDLYPIPDSNNYEIEFQCTVPQPDLKLNDDPMYVPKDPVVEGALARAITERGEDGGNGSPAQWMAYKATLSDHISIEANHFPDEMIWKPA